MLPRKMLFICILISSFIFTTNSYNHKCLRHQETLLLQLKDELIFNSSLSTKLVRWNESDHDCCKWYGVECDASGYVVSLQLDYEAITGGIGNSSSLFRFKYLQKLNLAYNEFNHDAIPKGIGNMTCLTHLNLSHAGFGGQVPSEISTLTRLASLDISNKYDTTLSLELPSLKFLVQNLTELKELYLDDVNVTSLHERKNWGHIISSHLPKLTSLSLVGCSLDAPLPKSFLQLHSLLILRLDRNNLSAVALDDLFTNFPSLTTLTLGGCKLKGSIPSTFASLTKLIRVDLSYNSLTGSLPCASFEGLSNLVYLNLLGNSLSGNIPQSLFALPSLLELSLSYNKFNGTFQLDDFQSLPNLTWLDLSGNNLSVDVGNVDSSSHGGLKLKGLGLSSCNLSKFPDLVKHLDLDTLDLSNNSIAGEIPSWIWGTQLSQLFLAGNNLSGSIPTSICNATRLFNLDLSRNKLSGTIPTCLCNATRLNSPRLSRNNLSGSIPACLLINMMGIDLSWNNISGSIPPFPLERITMLDLSHNNINRSIPDIFPVDCNLRYLDLSYNALEGKITKSLEHCTWLGYMNVGNNKMNDTFPCMLSSNMGVLVLRSNRFHGEVRCPVISWPNLQILDISSNHFTGSLESINFSSWTAMMLPSDGNSRGDTSFEFDNSGVTLIMKGQMMELRKIWLDFSAIDLSSNSFYGKIPNAIGDLSSLHLLNFSHNAINGSVPKSIGRLSNLESLDLSVSQLAGPIPKELGGLTFLSKLNLSYNKFVGEIPKGQQMQTFSADSFEGNPRLCGFPLNISCSYTNVPPPGYDEEENEIEWEYVHAALGYVVGFGSIVWLLLFCRSFREKYFGKIEEIVEDIFIVRDMRRRRARREAIKDRVRKQ